MEFKLKKRGGGVGGGSVLCPRGNAEAVLAPRNSMYSGTSGSFIPRNSWKSSLVASQPGFSFLRKKFPEEE